MKKFMKKFKKPIILFFTFALLAFFAPMLTGCKVDPREDSEIYSCFYYAVDGEDLSDQIVYYTLELRTDGVLITRYKTKKNSDSGRDNYYIENGYLVVTTYYGSKKYDMPGNEVIISEYVDNNYLLARFRLTQTVKQADADIYSCILRLHNETDVTADLKYFVASFQAEGNFVSWYRDKDKREKIIGTFTKYDWGYLAVEDSDENAEEPAREWRFEYKDDESLILKEEINETEVISKFINTQNIAKKDYLSK